MEVTDDVYNLKWKIEISKNGLSKSPCLEPCNTNNELSYENARR